MKNNSTIIEEFRLSQLSQTGIIVMTIGEDKINCGHNLFIPHRDNYYKLIILLQGKLKIMVDFDTYDIISPSLLLLMPGQVHQLSSVESPQGYFIGFDPSLITKDFAQLLIEWIKTPFVYNHETGIPAEVLKLPDLLVTILNGKPDAFINASAKGILTAILNLVVALSKSRPENPDGQTNQGRQINQGGQVNKGGHVNQGGLINQSLKIQQEFNILLKTNYKSWKRPSAYANSLSISVSHLNDTLKEITGKSVSVHIQEIALLEAKRLLFFTDLSVKEIGYELGYDDPNYFSRLFKKIENISPLEFRSQFRD